MSFLNNLFSNQKHTYSKKLKKSNSEAETFDNTYVADTLTTHEKKYTDAYFQKQDCLSEECCKAIELEKSGHIAEAVAIYEKICKSNFEGTHPYDRLAIYYRKQKDYINEKRILEKAIYVFSKVVLCDAPNRDKNIDHFTIRLEKLNSKYNSNQTTK